LITNAGDATAASDEAVGANVASDGDASALL